MSKYNDMKSCYSDKMFHYIDTMPSYNGCTLSIIIGYQNLVTIYETIITEVKQTRYNGSSVAYNLTWFKQYLFNIIYIVTYNTI